MNTGELVARLNNLDEQLCGAFGLARSADAADLDEAITMSTAPIALETARSLFQKAARKSDDRDAPEPEAAMAKVSGSRVAWTSRGTQSRSTVATLVVGRLSRLAGYLYREGLYFPERRGVDVETVGGAGDLVGLRARADLGGWAQVLPIAAGESAKVVDADRLDGGLARQVHYRGHP
jgi:hypothetical protein